MRVILTLEGAIECPAGSAALRATMLLLEGMAEQRSVRGAAERLGLSYRAAWGRLAGLRAVRVPSERMFWVQGKNKAKSKAANMPAHQ